MIFSGHNYIAIPEVDSLSFNVPVSLNSIHGSSSFGFSGSGSNGQEEILKFEFEDGRIKDFNGNYADSYFPNRNIDISGDIFARGHHYYINNKLVSLSGVQNYFRFKRFFYETSEEVAIESEASINITKPELSFNSPFYIDISGNYTGSFEKSVENTIHSFELDGLNHQMFDVSSEDLNPGNRTGSYVMTPKDTTALYSSTSYQVNLLLETDFGTVTQVVNFTGYNPSDGTKYTNGLTTNSNVINIWRDYPKSKRSNTYSLLYSILDSGTEQPKPIGVELSYYEGGTGHISGYRGDIEIVNSGSGFFTGDSYFYVTGGGYFDGDDYKAGGSGFYAEIKSDWFECITPCENRGTGNINGIEVINFGQNYLGPEEIKGYFVGNAGSGDPSLIALPYEYNKPFFETWDLHTGLTENELYSFSGNGLSGAPLINTSVYSDPNFSGGHSVLPSNTQSLYIQVDWEPLYDTNPVVAKLEITGENFTITEYITGIK
jgi:hypothetical protein